MEPLSRREVLQRASALGIGGLVLSSLPVAERILASAAPASAAPSLTDGTLQAYADTLIPGRTPTTTDLGNEIHAKAIAGAHREPERRDRAAEARADDADVDAPHGRLPPLVRSVDRTRR
jgi:hypothetical protein